MALSDLLSQYQNPDGSTNWSAYVNAQAQAGGLPAVYTNTSQPVSHAAPGYAGGGIVNGQLQMTPGVSRDSILSSAYQPGGSVYEGQQATGLRQQMQDQADRIRAQMPPSQPIGSTTNPDGSVTLQFAGGATQNVRQAPGSSVTPGQAIAGQYGASSFGSPSSPTPQMAAQTGAGSQNMSSLAPNWGSVGTGAGGVSQSLGGAGGTNAFMGGIGSSLGALATANSGMAGSPTNGIDPNVNPSVGFSANGQPNTFGGGPGGAAQSFGGTDSTMGSPSGQPNVQPSAFGGMPGTLQPGGIQNLRPDAGAGPQSFGYVPGTQQGNTPAGVSMPGFGSPAGGPLIHPSIMPGSSGGPTGTGGPIVGKMRPGGITSSGGAAQMYGQSLGLPNRGAPVPVNASMSTAPQVQSYVAPYAGANPMLGAIGQDITTQINNNLQRNVLPQITNGFVGTGGVGSSRQGIAQGLAIGDATRGLSGALAGMYGNDWTGLQNRNLQQYQGDQQFYTAQRGQDLAQTQLGANLYNLGSQGQWSPLQNTNGIYSQYTGFGNTSGSQQQGGGGMGAIGGAIGGATLGYGLQNGNLGFGNGYGTYYG